MRELCVRELCVREGGGRTGADGRAQQKNKNPTQRYGVKSVPSLSAFGDCLDIGTQFHPMSHVGQRSFPTKTAHKKCVSLTLRQTHLWLSQGFLRRTGRGRCDVRDVLDGDFSWQKLTGAKRREFSGMIHWLTINNHTSNPQQPIHSLRLAPRNRGNT